MLTITADRKQRKERKREREKRHVWGIKRDVRYEG